ncbi:unnamed protein product [Meloidogyne enterolobii]|uniref:Uncharacterized protein n=1 Tax=Meloidogyne enterolobii TaxID=390850 RepID=A0ACB0ZWF7_MELEN
MERKGCPFCTNYRKKLGEEKGGLETTLHITFIFSTWTIPFWLIFFPYLFICWLVQLITNISNLHLSLNYVFFNFFKNF